MSVWWAMFLGFVQGVTEFLPVSSSGHLAIFQNFFSMSETGGLLFEVLLHFATLIAVCIFFWNDIKAMFIEFTKLFNPQSYRSVRVPPARRLLFLIIVASLPLIVVAFFSGTVENLSTESLFIGIALMATGGILWLSDTLPKGNKDEKSATVIDVLFVGLMQMLAAMIPGFSRSGFTISTGLFRGFDRKFAVKLSFLMSVPAILGATVFKVKDAFSADFDWSVFPVYILGMVVAAVTGYFALCFIRYLVVKSSFRGFSYYCLMVGAATLIASFIIT
ncbi:MAG: undecaprenyl-diphosphate phosphatase [Oscillospiraceae bacterium]|nr:undecaprenyl-diphosphate phosphatase [Oscillospiraceae bacterium]